MSMRKLTKWNYVIIIVLSIVTVTIQSCSKDDDAVVPEEKSDENDKNDTDTDSSNNTGGDTGGDSGGNGDITHYRVNGDKLEKVKDYQVTGAELAFQKDVQKHQEIWNLVLKVVPPEYRSRMSDFVIYYGEKAGSAGYVGQTTGDLSKWQMGIAIDYAYANGKFDSDGELTHTVVHEFGHILTLDNTQLDSSVTQENCESYFPGEGCAKKEAYINKLYQNHWADIWSEYQKLKTEEDKEGFYNKYEKRFVTNYASTNPGEDIAEVFAAFVIKNSTNDASNGSDKINMLYGENSLVNLRKYIRGNIVKNARGLKSAFAHINTNRTVRCGFGQRK